MSYKLSPSALSLMKDCPRCFWLHHNESKKRPDSIFPSLPSGMDSILKKHFDKFAEKGTLPPELRKEKACLDCRLYDDFSQLKIWRSNFKGVSYTDKVGNILHGAIDNLLVKGRKFIVLDYKTRGFPLKDDTHHHYIDQMNLYNFLLRQNGHSTEDFSYLLFYHPKEVLETGEVMFNTDLVKVKSSAEDGEKLWKNALKCLEGPCPEKHGECEWCGFGGE
ncbi:MAG: PD-(D/E)XK nuclease family protein [Candidatus Pacearchaeota archaeon]|jgi:hypothetical protein